MYSSTRNLADIVQHLDEAVQQLHCLGLECVDLHSEHGVDVGVHLGAILALLRRNHECAASMLSELGAEHKVREDSPPYAVAVAGILKN